MPGDGGKEEERLEASSSKGHRGKAFTYPELMCCLFAALGTNEKFSAGKPGAVRLQTFNNAFVLRVRWMKEHDKWRDQFGKPAPKSRLRNLSRHAACRLTPPGRTLPYRIKWRESLIFAATTLRRVLTRSSTRMALFPLASR